MKRHILFNSAMVLVLFLSSLYAVQQPGLAYADNGTDEAKPIAYWKSECPELLLGKNVRECSVNRFGSIGTFGDYDVYYALYRRVKYYGEENPDLERIIAGERGQTYPNTAVALFRALKGADSAKPIWHAAMDYPGGSGWYEKPDIEGDFIAVPEYLFGSGHFITTRYLYIKDIAQGKDVRALNTDEWYKDLKKWLPEGHGIWQGVYINMKTLSASSRVWKDSDGNCCPTGGSLSIKFRVEDSVLRIDHASYSDECYGGDYCQNSDP